MYGKKTRAVSSAGLIALLIFLASSCRTKVDPYEEELTVKEYFKGAVEASEAGDYKHALEFYNAYLQKYPLEEHPDEFERNLWAHYEIAFCNYKLKRYKIAANLFEELLSRYESFDERDDLEPDSIPQGPRILAEKVLDKIYAKIDPSKATGARAS
jgi:outer membrane protein assembly factor BamD (BamD/ComL family)